MSVRVAVLASGSGTNLQAIFDYFDALGPRAGASVTLVASDRVSAGALDRARARDIAGVHLDADHRGDAMVELLEGHHTEIVALAGYLRFVPPAVTRRWHGRVLNVHPSLLPAFGGAGMYGTRVHQAVLDAGVRVTGVTVHFVDEEYDRGPIIAQWPVPVLPHDTPESLARRVLAVEHVLFPRAVRAVALGRVTLGADGRVSGVGEHLAGCAAYALSGAEVAPDVSVLFPGARAP
ncbi:MAG TPA: phosphoribosylglycinamide formyltransferase [Gemmatimonadaceae bacterium]|jgi:formyltetrahydrofolate-dependent phosphoribosylglycinamide formyltransferase|nr:phosphoribosylglycinamide formyltransferase [Gemmatimonadaceae bacterium]